MSEFFGKFSERVATAAGHHFAFLGALFFVLLWLISGPMFGFSDTWQLVINTSTTIVTFLIVFLIQNSQNRDSCAIQAKLDELINAVAEARKDAIGIEHLSLDKLEAFRSKIEERSAASLARNTRGTKPPSKR